MKTNAVSLSERLRSLITEHSDWPKPGISFKDISPILRNPALCKEIITEFYNSFKKEKIDGVIGIDSRGFYFGIPLAQEFNTSFIPARKSNKLPGETVSIPYGLEYGNDKIEIQKAAIKQGGAYLINDDLLASGGTATAVASLVELLGAKVVGFTFVVTLDFIQGNRVLLNKFCDEKKIVQLVSYQ